MSTAKIGIARLKKAAWGKALAVAHYRMATAPVLTDRQRERVLAEKSREAAELHARVTAILADEKGSTP